MKKITIISLFALMTSFQSQASEKVEMKVQTIMNSIKACNGNKECEDHAFKSEASQLDNEIKNGKWKSSELYLLFATLEDKYNKMKKNK